MRRAARGEARRFFEDALGYPGLDCLTWPFAQTANGYGLVLCGGKARIVSRVICEIINGAHNDPEMEAAHSCGNRLCCNPAHIRWASAKENAADRLLHGTDQNGAKNHQAKLTAEIVAEILSRPHLSQRALGKIYRIDPSVICRIRRGQSWVGSATQ